MTAIVTWSGASVGYGERGVLSGVDLALGTGEVLGIVGPNGSGKSTLLKAITGEATITSGLVSVDGMPIGSITAAQRARIVAVVPQKVDAAFLFTAREFVEMGRHAHIPRFAPPSAHDRRVVDEMMDRTDTAHLASRSVDELSGGELQRLAFAQALAQEPRVLLLDEPTNHLDLNHRLQVLDLARDLAREGMAVLSVFHDLDLAARYSDRMAVVFEGRVESADAPSRVLTSSMVRSVFGVRAVVEPDPVSGAISVTPILRDAAVLPASPGRILVIGGSGVAAPTLRRLTLAGWDVCSGALNEGDSDATVCAALGLDYVSVPPFASMTEGSEAEVEALAETVDEIVVCDVPFGHGNLGNLRALACHASKTVLVGSIENRDYCDGEARGLWELLVSQGARMVDSADDAFAVRG